MSEKICSTCKVFKQTDQFYLTKKLKSGLSSQCKTCTRAGGKIYYAKNSEKRTAKTREWRTVNRDRARAKEKAYYEANRETCNAQAKAYYEKNKEVLLEKGQAYREKNRERRNEKQRQYVAENSEKVKASGKEYHDKNRELRNARCRAYRAANKERLSELNKQWRLANPEKCRALRAKRRAALVNRTPGWLTKEDYDSITFIYEMARVLEDATGIPHHVDHEYPLQGELVSGLHCPLNLQVITASENCRKRNKWTPE